MCSAATPIDHLFTALNLQIVGDEDDFGPSAGADSDDGDNATTNDGKPRDYWPGSDGLAHKVATMQVIGEGGASGRSTTTIDGVEFSATGRIGVSLAELAAVKEVGFAFSRATSRLHEMSGAEFGRGAKKAW